MIADSKYCLTFVFVSSNVGAVKPDYKGNFFAQDISGAAPPSEMVNALGSPCVGTDNGTGGTVYLLPIIKINVMSELRNPSESSQQANSAEKTIKELLNFIGDLQFLRDNLSAMTMDAMANDDDKDHRHNYYSTFIIITGMFDCLAGYQMNNIIGEIHQLINERE